MIKSYKCDFCEYDRGPIKQAHEKCSNCKYGSEFERKKRISDRQVNELTFHTGLDDYINSFVFDMSDHEREYIHRLREMNLPCSGVSGRGMRLYQGFKDTLYFRDKLNKESKDE